MKLISLLIMISFQARADMAMDLLTASDQGRGGIKDGISWAAVIETTEDGETSKREFSIKAKGHDAYVQATAPSRNKGEVFLFNDRNMWFFKPSLKKPVAISARQKLTGQAANGDIASTHYARDYTPTLEKSETINGEKIHVLHLKAKSNNLTYDQIRYWISEKSKLAIKAEFLTLQGAVFKSATMEYNNKLSLNGKSIPFISKLNIQDAKFKENQSSIIYQEPKIQTFSPSVFNVNNLSR